MSTLNRYLNFTQNQAHYSKPENAAYAKALVGLMLLSGVNRLFEKEDVYELIKRAQLLFPELHIIDRFFTDDSLFAFKFKILTYQLTLKDLEALIGLEALNRNENHVPFSKWEANVGDYKIMYDKLIADGVFWGLKLTPCQLELTNQDSEKEVNRTDKTTSNRISYTPEELWRAEFLGDGLTKEIPEALFDRVKLEFPNKIKELKLRQAPFDEPLFNFESYPKATQHILLKHLFPDLELFNYRGDVSYWVKIVYLAWLWANGFVMKDSEEEYHVDERITSINLDDYKDDEGIVDLETTYEVYALKELASVLYDPEVAKMAQRPWENLDVYKKISTE